MISFNCDYSEGAHPLILERLAATNFDQEPGYGFDSHSEHARELIRQATACPEADVTLLVGGTQTNATVIDALLEHCQAVIAVDTGHIAVHEAGAIEHSGHKVITIPHHDGKMLADDLNDYLTRFYADPTWPHMAQPGMVYLSFPTEYGTIYSRAELEALYAVCRRHDMPLMIDGARLGYGLASEACDMTLPDLARLCDVFYIGGTKVGALCGEAVVFPRGNAPKHFFSIVKQHGALMAKGRLLGVQFETLFTDDLYMRLSRHAIEMANELKNLFKGCGIPMFIDSPTNQQFPILTPAQMQALEGKVSYELWTRLDDGRAVTRFATSWATPLAHVDTLASLL
jgi:threonine aldolase